MYHFMKNVSILMFKITLSFVLLYAGSASYATITTSLSSASPNNAPASIITTSGLQYFSEANTSYHIVIPKYNGDINKGEMRITFKYDISDLTPIYNDIGTQIIGYANKGYAVTLVQDGVEITTTLFSFVANKDISSRTVDVTIDLSGQKLPNENNKSTVFGLIVKADDKIVHQNNSLLTVDVQQKTVAIVNNIITGNLEHSNTAPFAVNIYGNIASGNDLSSASYYWYVSIDGGPFQKIAGATGIPLLSYTINNYCSVVKIYRGAYTSTVPEGNSNIITIKPSTPNLNNIISLNSSFGAAKLTSVTYASAAFGVQIYGATPTGGNTCSQTTSPNYQYTWETQILDPVSGIDNNIWMNVVDVYSPSFVLTGPVTLNRKIRRKVTNANNTAIWSYSNEILISFKPCSFSLTFQQQNIICGDQKFYNVGASGVQPTKLWSNPIIQGNISRHGYEWEMSTDKINWQVVKARRVILVREDQFPISISTEQIDCAFAVNDVEDLVCKCIEEKKQLEYIPSRLYIPNGKSSQTYYFRRVYYRYYRDCWTDLCPLAWHDRTESNIVEILLGSGNPPKPVQSSFNEPVREISCKDGDQTLNLSLNALGNGEYYKWTYPSTWTAYGASEGSYVNSLTFNTNAANKSFVQGGDVCVEISQIGKVDKVCRTFVGTNPLGVSLQPLYSACVGEQIALSPNVTNESPSNLNYAWTLNNSSLGSTGCKTKAIDNSCAELYYSPKNIVAGNTQNISLAVTSAKGCKASSQTQISSEAGWYFGTLNYQDPIAIDNSDLILDNIKNELYYVRNDKHIIKANYGNPDPLIKQEWNFTDISGSSTNQPKSDQALALYRNGNTYRLFYVQTGKMKYIESLDKGITWNPLAVLVPYNYVFLNKLKVYGNYLYAVNQVDRFVYRIDLNNLNAVPVQVSNIPVNYSNFMFTVSGGILAYANTSNKLVMFNAMATNTVLNSVSPEVTWDSDIAVYANKIYWVYNGDLYNMSLNSNNLYDNPTLIQFQAGNYVTSYNAYPKLEGKFCINPGTGVIYAKDQVTGNGSDHLFQISFRNSVWRALEIGSTQVFSSTGIGYNFVYGFEHTYYIGADGRVGNSFHLEPCRPDVMRKITEDEEYADHKIQDLLFQQSELQAVPNPVADFTQIQYELPEASTVILSIVDQQGREEVLESKELGEGAHSLLLDLQHKSKGLYTILLKVSGQSVKQVKIIKQ